MKKAVAVTTSKDSYRRSLLSKRDDVLSGLGIRFDTMARMGRVAEDDQAQLTHDEFISLRLNSLVHSQLRMVEEALDRLDSGEYGNCLNCEEPIPPKRLMALPWARYCVTCQERLGEELAREEDTPGLSRTPLQG